jgi:hypothetical protein
MSTRTQLRPVTAAESPRTGRRGLVRIQAVGESRYQADLCRLAGGTREESQAIATNAEIWREPENPFDPSAVQVRIAGKLVAYLPRAAAASYGARMDSRGRSAFACPAEIRGGWRDEAGEGYFGVVVWLPPPNGI